MAVFLTKQRQETRKRATGSTVNVACIGRTANSCQENQEKFYGLLVVHKFESEAACQACQNNPTGTCEGAYLVGQLDTCGNRATCTPVGECTANQSDGAHCSCGFTQNVPPCSVVQLDCLNGPYPPGGGITQGTIAWNCSGPCGSPTNTPPAPTPTATPPTQLTPTPTTTPNPTGTPQPTATPTQPGYTASCLTCKAYDTNWNQITPSSIQLNQTVYFATQGSTNHPQGITKARFRINGGTWQETTNKHGGLFYIQFTVSSPGSYTVESMVYNPVMGWY